ncbi:MAG: MarR family transcriptional regulator [Phycisphaeraceae bacterium]|nr:MarR family transcriptional regulator [Phycisphaeraceae bacterium]MCW5761857.1 MarR family transcriptional regulator [Phycisphaeraceae bacterium]
MDQSPLAAEIGKKEPFEHAEQEAFLNLMRTVSILEADFKSLFRKHGLSSTTYNLLRILRGHKPHGLRCTQIKCELVSRVPDITRLVDRLEESGLVRRAADPKDARAVVIHITPKGYRVLEKLDEPVTNLHRRQLGHLSPQELAALNDLLAKARHPA